MDVSHLGLTDENGLVDIIQAKPLTVGEYQTLKSAPEVGRLSGEDRTEALGLRMSFEMLSKCDSSLTWSKWKQLPLNVLTGLAQAVVEAVGTPAGGGALGES